jgi:hypothetical protein
MNDSAPVESSQLTLFGQPAAESVNLNADPLTRLWAVIARNTLLHDSKSHGSENECTLGSTQR